MIVYVVESPTVTYRTTSVEVALYTWRVMNQVDMPRTVLRAETVEDEQ